MRPVIDILEERVSAAMAAVAGVEDCAAIVRPAADPKFGDYQVNGVMPLAKKLKTNPRKLAEEVAEKLDLSDMCEPPEAAGPGFINLRLKPDFIAGRLLDVSEDAESFAVDKAAEPKTIVVDFSSPNIAKQMHVGHLRSTIIGDCICRMLEFLGHKVIRQNHIGDWGTQFGMLMALLSEKLDYVRKHTGMASPQEFLNFPLEAFEDFYKEAKRRYDSDEEFAASARAAVVGLHGDDPAYTLLWGVIVDKSRERYQGMYNVLGVDLSQKNERGESEYRKDLPGIVQELLGRRIAEESHGAVCVFPKGFKTKEGKRLPFIIRKSDGAYLYATTDLAALRYRVNELKADAIIYVTDARQKQHFEMLFAVARMAGWDIRQETGDRRQKTELVHVMFGSILGDDGTPLKTRSGENVKLKELLDEAVERAKAVVEEKNPELSASKKEEIANAVGIGAVKYADYSNNRTSDYVFSFDKMLAMEGNTAPYMQYAYARIKSIERKAHTRDVDIETELAGLKKEIENRKSKIVNLNEPAELDLAKYLLRYAEAIQAAVADYRPNYLTGYLYELAQKFSVFYTNCPVLGAGPDKRPTRLLLCDLTARIIKHGLSELLGIEVVEQM